MKPEEAVDLARRMREAGAVRFTLKGDSLTCVLRPPDPKPMDEIIDRINEMTPEARQRIIKQTQEDLDRDLYGASRG